MPSAFLRCIKRNLRFIDHILNKHEHNVIVLRGDSKSSSEKQTFREHLNSFTSPIQSKDATSFDKEH